MSTLAVNTIQAQTGTTVSVPTGQTLYAPGHVLQVVHHNSGTNGTEFTTTGNTFVSGGSECSITITPKFANSIIRVTASFNTDSAYTDSRPMYTFFRSINGGSYSNLYSANTQGYDAIIRNHAIGERLLMQNTMDWYDDNHNTTNSITYRVYFKNQNSGGTARIRNDIAPCVISATEIAQ